MSVPSSTPTPHPAHRSISHHDPTSGIGFLEELFHHISSRSSYSEDRSGHVFVPRFDVEIHPDSYELYGELPGFDHDHVTVEANDDRNIQISGWISRHQHADTTVDPTVPVQHNASQSAKTSKPETARFGDVLDPHATFADVPGSINPGSFVTSTPVPAKPSGPETARFGDELDPHADFVHEPSASKPSTDTPAPAPAKPDGPETARFGDELDPHAEFVHKPSTSKALNDTPAPQPAKPAGPETARFGDELDPHAEFVHDPLASTLPATDKPAPAPAPTSSRSTRPKTAQFADVLDPHAQFVHRPAASHHAKGSHTKFLIAERRYGQFSRAFHFPAPFRKDEVQARLDNGILHVTVPRAAVGPPTKVVVKKGGR